MTRFFDTNLLVYAQQQGPKAEIARRVMAEGGMISVQVINEFTAVSRRKLGRSWPEIEEALRDILAVMAPPLHVTAETSAMARELAAAHELSFYDALIIAAAVQAGCATLFSEDMQAGRRFGELAIVNPFAG